MNARFILTRLALIVFGFLLFGLLELSLRVFWHPPATASEQLLLSSIDPFTRDGDFFTTKTEYRSSLRTQRFSAVKEKDTLRVFCFGGSATFGYPYPDKYSWPSALQRYLQTVSTEHPVEVINLGGTSYGTSRVLGLLRGVLKYSPDLIIIYSGNNEFVEDSYKSQAVSKLESSTIIENLYISQLLLGVFYQFHKVAEPQYLHLEPGDSSHFFFSPTVDGTIYKPTDLQVTETLQTYRENLEAILSLTQRHGIPVILSTVGSNLSSWAPDTKGTIPSPEIRPIWNHHLASAEKSTARNNIDAAISSYYKAIYIFDGNAAANFELGKLLLDAGKPAAALPLLIRARDLDPVPIRATSEMNHIVKTTAQQHSEVLIDIESILSSASPHGIPGDRFYFDNVHPTVLGNLLIAQAFSRDIPKILSLPNPSPAHFDQYWNREIEQSSSPPPIDATIAFTWGQVYVRKGLYDKAEEMFRVSIAQGYSHPSVDLYLADVLSRKGRLSDAFSILQMSIGKYPDFKESYQLYGRLAENLGKVDIAIRAYREAIQTNNPPPDIFATLALLLLDRNQPGEAERVCKKGLDLYPGNCRILNSLGRVHEWKKEIDLAEKVYRTSIGDDPSCQPGWENLGLLHMNFRSLPETIETFGSALESPAASPFHHLNLGLAYLRQGSDISLARKHFRRFAELKPDQVNLIPAPHRELSVDMHKQAQ